ncbi:saccharopine dehydrogenase NADP-binding domain-containing protein [Gammaproteobacteria bacterium]|nr:saccharopine dehydrogenase NADP-binding domain-containing protein [bacterium]MDB9769398.1 saccharopine dehydrogenase NADP-binding domain-containing protein [Gammaproteobacteria bacterium]
MKILAIGGCGSMARYALKAAQNFDAIDEIIIADINEESATSFAATLNNKVSAVRLDVSDNQALKLAMKNINIVVNTCGPFFKFGEPILSAAIDSGCHYLDICDDWEPTLEMMKLDTNAKSAGVSATIGLGASPGLTNLMALIAIRELDEVTTVYTGWDAGAATIDETAKQQSTNAAMLHAIEQMTGKVKIYQDSAYQMVKPLQAINVEYPGLPNLTGNIFGHPEAVTFPHYFSELKDCINLAHGGSLDSIIIKVLTGLVNIGFLSKAKASNLFSWLESQESQEKKPNANNHLPSMYGFAHGSKNGVPGSVGVCIMNDDDSFNRIGMGEITGIPLACGIKMLAEGKINEAGVLAPEAGHIDPHDFISDVLDEISKLLDLPTRKFEENIRITRSWSSE